MNENIRTGFGDLYIAYLLGKVSEYCDRGNLIGHIIEFIESLDILKEYESKVALIENWDNKNFDSLWQFRAFRIVLYALVRDIKPNLVVETGVLHGMTSGFILDALSRNTAGRLISIDFPSYSETGPANNDGYNATLPINHEPGWIVPDRLRGQWDLYLGKSVDILSKLDKEINGMDLFCHDSEHTYSTMWSELNFAWDRLAPQGILVCDNIEANTAFFDFCRRVNRIPLVLPTPSNDILYAPRFAIVRRDK